MMFQAGIAVVDVPYVSLGGAIGSFVLMAYLRIAVVSRDRIPVLANIDKPCQTYWYLTRVSPIPQQERLRSDSSSCPVNMCGYPSYAVRGAFSGRRLKCLCIVLTEPIFNDYYTSTRRSARGTRGPPGRRTGRLCLPADRRQRETSGLAAGSIGRHAELPWPAFMIDFAVVWIGTWLWTNGLMRVALIRWRLRDGRRRLI
jgi:hypothetical protein